MNETPTRIVSAERACGGLVISFEDGVIAMYSAELLRSVLDKADDLSPLEWEDPLEDRLA